MTLERHGRTLLFAALSLPCVATSADAQLLVNAADSAASARRLVSGAVAALGTGDTVAAHRGMKGATEVWPTQPAYLRTRAQLAAATHDTSDVVTALTQFVALGGSRALATDRLLTTWAASPRLDVVRAALSVNGAPLVHSTVRATSSDATSWPEGVTHDARTQRLFVGSVRHRTIYEQSDTTTRALSTGTAKGVGAILGVPMDADDRPPLFRSLQGVAPAPDGRHVYVADYSHGLLRLELASGAVTRLPDAPSSTSLGVDGLVWFEGSLIGVQNGVAPPRIVRFLLDASGTHIDRQETIDRNTTIADEPTIGVIVGRSYVYVANSQWDKHDDAGARVAGSQLSPVLLLAVSLPR